MQARELTLGLKLVNMLSQAYERDCTPGSAKGLPKVCETAAKSNAALAYSKVFSSLQRHLEAKGARRTLESLQSLFEAIDDILDKETNGEVFLLAHCAAAEMALQTINAGLSGEASAWLSRRSAYDYQCSWLAILGLGKNPFVREHPLSVPGFTGPLSELLSLLVSSNDIIRLQGSPDVGKTAFLHKLCESLLSQQLNGRSVLPCYVPNQRSSAKLFAIDIFAGVFTRYSVDSKRLKLAELFDYSPFEELLDEHVVLPGHVIEDIFKKITANDIVRQIALYANSNRLALVVLLDDANGKIRGPLSATQVNTLVFLQQQCEISAVIAATAPDKALPRVLEDHRRGDLNLWGLRQTEVQAAIQAFYKDASKGHVGLRAPKPLSAARLYEITIAPWEKELLGESYFEDKDGEAYYHPRRAKRMAALTLERLSTDISNVRFAPANPADITHVKRSLAQAY
jgi:hypothetical protein